MRRCSDPGAFTIEDIVADLSDSEETTRLSLKDYSSSSESDDEVGLGCDDEAVHAVAPM